MPTILTHPAVPLAIALGLGQRAISRRLLLVGVLASAVPDLDVIAFRFGIPYAADLGHRGFSHSLLFAALVGVVGAALARSLLTTRWKAFWFIAIATASHGMLDAFTNGGLGVAFLWPYSGERFFAPFQVIEVSPIGLSRFMSDRGKAVLLSELFWVWLPFLGVAAIAAMVRRRRAATPELE